MSELLVISQAGPTEGLALRDRLLELRRQGLIRTEDIVCVTRDAQGDVALHQSSNTTAMGALGGAVWGGVLGLVFLSPVIGAVIGAGAGVVAGHATDLGLNDGFLRRLGTKLPTGGAAVFVLVPKERATATLDQLHTLGYARDSVLHSRDDPDFQARLTTVLTGGGATTLSGPEVTRGLGGRIVGASAL